MSSLAGTGALVRLALRRDRVMIPAWVLVLLSLVTSTASAFRSLYPTPESRLQFAGGILHSPTLVALYGPLYNPDSVGGLTAWRILAVAATLAALMSVLLVVRHSRAEEEAGRLELVGSAAVGRLAPLTAALLVAAGADLLLALLAAAGLAGLGLPAAGALALGLALGAAGLVFAAVAAVASQLSGTARGATGLAGAALGAAYLLRAVGDATTASWLSWLSPIGWAERVRPFAGDRLAVAGLAVAVSAALAAAAYALVARRDLGAGLLPVRPGPAQASPWLRSPLALAWRLQRGPLLGWAAGFAVMGAAAGSVARGVEDLVRGSAQLEDIIRRMGGERGLVDSYLATVMGLAGLIAGAYAVQATLRLRAEETGQRAEPLLAAPVSRIAWAWSHLVFAVAGSGVVLAAAGAAAGVSDGLRAGDVGGDLGRLLEGALVQLPAVWVVAGIATLLFGVAPRVATASWGALGAFLLLGQSGPGLGLSPWVIDLSP
ncbi:MAG TPA: ABC transporter permease, partial [Candidatus Dormibacteraeota bacterium]